MFKLLCGDGGGVGECVGVGSGVCRVVEGRCFEIKRNRALCCILCSKHTRLHYPWTSRARKIHIDTIFAHYTV